MAEKLVTFAHISDTHLHANPAHTTALIPYPALEPVQKLIQFINAFDADIDFVLHTGDIMHDPQTPQEYTMIRKLMDTFQYPVHYIPGNHDHVMWMQSHFIGRNEAEITPTYDTSFEMNGVQFILLDSHAPAENPGAAGFISSDQLHWLDSLLETDDTRPLIVAVHHHTLPVLAPWLDRIGMTNGEDLHHALLQARHRLRGIFYGHIHETLITVRDGIPYYSAQSGWYQTRTYHAQEQPALDPLTNPGFNLVTITEKDTFIRTIRIPE